MQQISLNIPIIKKKFLSAIYFQKLIYNPKLRNKNSISRQNFYKWSPSELYDFTESLLQPETHEYMSSFSLRILTLWYMTLGNGVGTTGAAAGGIWESWSGIFRNWVKEERVWIDRNSEIHMEREKKGKMKKKIPCRWKRD